jgi:Histidine kinase
VIGVSFPQFDTRRAIIWGASWGVIVSLVEFLAILPIDAWGSPQQLLWWLLTWMMPVWCLTGAAIVWLSDQGARLAGMGGAIGGFVVLCVLFSAANPPLAAVLLKATDGLLPSLERYLVDNGITAPTRANWSTLGLYQLWVTLFHGALLMAACMLTLRTERARHLLHESAMARSRTQALVDSERLRALQTQIDPTLLLETMRELERRYRASPDSAERLLEALVEFMRYAMQGLRMPVSTLDAELQLARSFAQLQRERGVDGAWRVDAEAGSHDSYRFPSLLMLPLLALGGEGRRPLLRVKAEPHQLVLSLHGLAHGLSVELSQQIRAGLHALYGTDYQIHAPSPESNQLAIILHAHSINTGEHHDRSSR